MQDSRSVPQGLDGGLDVSQRIVPVVDHNLNPPPRRRHAGFPTAHFCVGMVHLDGLSELF